MDTGYPAMIPDVQPYPAAKETEADLAALETHKDTEAANNSDSLPFALP